MSESGREASVYYARHVSKSPVQVIGTGLLVIALGIALAIGSISYLSLGLGTGFPQSAPVLTVSPGYSKPARTHPEAPPAPVQHRARYVTVQPGDSLWSIAAAKLGDGSRWPRIVKLNHLTSSGVQPGEKLRV